MNKVVKKAKNLRGTVGALGSTYSEDQWIAIAAVIGPTAEFYRPAIERIAKAYLASPTVAETARMAEETVRHHLAIQKSTSRLLSDLECAGFYDPASGGDQGALIRELENQLQSSEWAIDYWKDARPHKNSLAPWHGFLFELCMIWDRYIEAGERNAPKRGPDNEPYGRTIDFLLAAAGPLRRPAEVHDTAFSAEAAHKALERYDLFRKGKIDLPFLNGETLIESD